MVNEEELLEYILKDLGHSDSIDRFKRSELLNRYQQILNISQRELAKKINVPRSTVGDWMLWEKDEFDKLKKEGLNNKEIYKKLRNTKFNQKEETLNIKVGAILLATGFDPYEPKTGEFGYNEIDNVITLQQFKRLIELCPDKLIYKDKETTMTS